MARRKITKPMSRAEIVAALRANGCPTDDVQAAMADATFGPEEVEITEVPCPACKGTGTVRP